MHSLIPVYMIGSLARHSEDAYQATADRTNGTMTRRIKMTGPRKKERRTCIRVPIRAPVTVEFPPRIKNRHAQGTTRDISFDGAFIENISLTPQEGTLARLSLAAASGNPVVIDALVLRNDVHGTVLMFAAYGDEVFAHLTALFETGLGKYFRVQ